MNKPLALVPVDTNVGCYTRRCAIVLIIGVLGFVGWAAWAPLGQGVSVAGHVTVQGERKTITHPMGGIVKTIVVQEGERVAKGQVLAYLDPTLAQATVDELASQRLTWAARLSSLGVQVDHAFLDDPFFQAQLHAEQAAQKGKATALQAELQSMQHTTQMAIGSIHAIERGLAAKREQLALLETRVGNHKALQASGFMSGNAVADSELQRASVQVSIQDDLQKITQFKGQIAEAKARMIQLKAQFEAVQQADLSEAKKQLLTFTEQQGKAQFEKQQTAIHSPVDGYVLGLKLFTEGAAIPAGVPLMDIAPMKGDLEITGVMATQFRDQVRPGLTVTVRFSALQTAKTVEVRGVVGTVGADALQDPKTGQGQYPMKVVLDDRARDELKRHNIGPGMPAEMLINTGERTFLSYLLRPLGDKFFHALKEY